MDETLMPSGQRIYDQCQTLGRLSEEEGALTRIFLSKEQAQANELVLGWMREAGMDHCYLDAIGNVVGRYEGNEPGLPCLLMGSHLDTVRNAGKYDGMLGVVAAIECVRTLHHRGQRLPFALVVVGFSDEEGVRFGATLLGSPRDRGHLQQEPARQAGPPSHHDAPGDARLRARPRAHRRGRVQARAGARLRRAAHRAGAGAGGRRACRWAS